MAAGEWSVVLSELSSSMFCLRHLKKETWGSRGGPTPFLLASRQVYLRHTYLVFWQNFFSPCYQQRA